MNSRNILLPSSRTQATPAARTRSFIASSRKFRGGIFLAAAFAAMLSCVQRADAQGVWLNTGTDFNNPANWGGTLQTGSNVTFTGIAVTQPTLSASFTVDQIVFSSTNTFLYNIGSSSPSFILTATDTTPVAASNTTGTNTISAALNLGETTGNSANFNQAKGGTLVISGPITSTNAVKVVMNNTGTVVFSGSNSFTGSIALQQGVLNIQNAAALGASSNTINFNGGTLQIQGGITIAQSGTFTASNTGPAQTAVLVNTGGNNTLTGNFLFTSNSTIGADSGTLNFTGGTIDLSNSTMGIQGVGNGVIASTMVGVVNTGGKIAMNSSGTWTISGNNSFTGGITVNNGLLNVTGTQSGTGSIVINGGTFRLGASNLLNNNVQITTGSTAFLSGALDLNNTNQTIGAFIFGSQNSNTASGANLNIGSGTLTVGGTIAYMGNFQGATVSGVVSTGAVSTLTLNAAHSIFSNGPDLTISANIIGAQGVTGTNTNTGPGTSFIVLSGSNSYSGSTIVNTANTVLVLKNSNALGSTAAGTSINNGSVQLVGGITIAGEALTMNGFGANGQNGNLVGVSGNNAWTGNIVTLGNTTISVDGGTLNLSGNISIAGTLLFYGAGSGTVSGIVSGTSLGKGGSGSWTLNGAVSNTYASNTTVNGGNLIVDFSNMATPTNLIASTSTLTLGGGRLTIKGNPTGVTSQTLGNLTTIGATGSVIVINPNGGTSTTLTLNSLGGRGGNSSLLIDASAAGASIVKANVGNNSGANGLYTYVLFKDSGGTGFATVTGSTVTRYNDASLATALATNSNVAATNFSTLNSVYTGGVLAWSNGITNRSVNSLIVDTTTTGGVIDMGASTNVLTLTGSAILFRGANNETLTGGQVGASATEVMIHQVGTGTFTLNSAISAAAGSLTLDGGGVLALGGTNAYTGSTVVNSGTLIVNGGTSSSVAYAINNGRLILGASNVLNTSGTVVLANMSDVTSVFDLNGNNQTLANIVFYGNNSDNASQGLVTTGAGTLTLTGSILYNTVTTGSGNSQQATISGNLALTSGTHFFNVTHSQGSGGADLVVSANISGVNASISGTNSGVIALTGSNSFTGTLTAGGNSNVISLQNSNATAGATQIVVATGGAVQLQGNVAINTPMQLLSTGFTSAGNNNSLPQTGGLVNSGGTNSYTGLITLTNQNATISSDVGSLTVGNITSGTNPTLFLTGAASGTVAGNITLNTSGTNNNKGQLQKNGTGSWTLNGTNNFAGNVTINSGTLVVNGDNSAANGTWTINPGGVLAGTGTIGGGISMQNVNANIISTAQPTINLVDGIIGKLTVLATTNTLQLSANGPVNFDFEVSNNAADLLVLNGPLVMNAGGATISITQLPSTAIQTGTYNLITYTAFSGNGQFNLLTTTLGGNTLKLVQTGTAEQLLVIAPNFSQLAITPSGTLTMNLLSTGAQGTVTGTLTNTGTSGNADYLVTSTGSISIFPTSSTGVGGSGATLAANGGSQALSVSGSATGVSGTTPITLGTFSATNLSNSQVPGGGNSNSVVVTATLWDPAAVTSSNGNAVLTNTAVGSNGANSLIASAKVQKNALNNNSSVTQDPENWNMLTPGLFASGSSVTVASLNPDHLLNGTYIAQTNLQVGSFTTSGSLIAGGSANALNNATYNVTATVTGNKSSSAGDVYQADIITTYAGYNIGSAVPGTTHTNTGSGGTTVGSLVYGNIVTSTTRIQMSFDSTPVNGNPDTARNSDIFTLNNIEPVSQGDDGRFITGVYVMTLSYDANMGGLAYIVQNTNYGWINAVAENDNSSHQSTVFNPSGDNITFQDDGGASALHETFTAYLLSNGGVATPGAYGYSNGVAWAVMNHDALSGFLDSFNPDWASYNGVGEFAVVAQAVPEPGTYAMVFTGFGMLAAFRKMRRRR